LAAEKDRKPYFVSVNHGLIQNVRNETGEFEVWLSDEELTILQDQLKALQQDDEYSFRRAFVPYKSADHDDAIDQFDDKTIRLYEYLRQYGTPETQKIIDQLGVLPKLENTGYEDKGYGEGSPTNK